MQEKHHCSQLNDEKFRWIKAESLPEWGLELETLSQQWWKIKWLKKNTASSTPTGPQSVPQQGETTQGMGTNASI